MELDFRGARSGQSLERRVARLEDIDAVKRVKAAYAQFCDHGYEPDGLLSLFTEDAVWESNSQGTYRGHAALRRYFESLPKTATWAHHCMICPVIDIDEAGDKAVGEWYLLGLSTMANKTNPTTRESFVVAATYNDNFVKRAGVWKFSHIRAQFHQRFALLGGPAPAGRSRPAARN